MSSDFSYDEKGKVKPKPSQETVDPQLDQRPLTTADIQGNLDAKTLTRMQQTVGNAAVQRFLAQRSASGQAEVDDETAGSISSARGGGNSLDEGIASKAGGVMGQDFSGVNVHTDSQADTLSRQLGAKAFTTGNDIFFQEGAYSPGTSDGQRLISHELTHVVQQGASPPSVQGKMTVNDPNDQYESEADQVADTIMNAPDEAAVQREEAMPEDELAAKLDPTLQRQGMDEEPMPKLDPALQRQPEAELEEGEDVLREKPDPDLQRIDEEEPMAKLDPALQRQEDEEMGPG